MCVKVTTMHAEHSIPQSHVLCFYDRDLVCILMRILFASLLHTQDMMPVSHKSLYLIKDIICVVLMVVFISFPGFSLPGLLVLPPECLLGVKLDIGQAN